MAMLPIDWRSAMDLDKLSTVDGHRPRLPPPGPLQETSQRVASQCCQGHGYDTHGESIADSAASPRDDWRGRSID